MDQFNMDQVLEALQQERRAQERTINRIEISMGNITRDSSRYHFSTMQYNELHQARRLAVANGSALTKAIQLVQGVTR